MKQGIVVRRLVLMAVALLSLLPVISCGGNESAITVITEDPTGTAAATTFPGTTATTATTASSAPAGTADKPFTAGPYSGGTQEAMVLRDIRFGKQEDYERIVIEFAGQAADPADSLPGYTVTRGTPPYFDANGNEVYVAGDAYIEVRANGNTADLSADPSIVVYDGPDYIEPGLDLFYSAELVPAYEDNTVILLIDLKQALPFRVGELVSPARIVIDIEG